MNKNLKELEKIIDHNFKKIKLLEKATLKDLKYGTEL